MAGTLKQIAIYPEPKLREWIEREATFRRRKLGPTVVEILFEWFKRERGLAPDKKKS